jgi:hypothetical protein
VKARVEPRDGRSPLRTCVGCRRVRPQHALLRVCRGADGMAGADPDRRGSGRGAYLCYDERCLQRTERRSPWAHAFRAPTVMTPEAAAHLRALLVADRSVTGRGSEPFEGGW